MLLSGRINSFGIQPVAAGGDGGSGLVTGYNVLYDPSNTGTISATGRNVNDISGVGTAANAVFNSNVTFATNQATGSNGAFLVSGGNYAPISSSKFAVGTGGFALSMWFKLTDVSTYSILWSFDGSNTNSGVFAVNPTSGGWGATYYANGFRIQDNVTSYGTTTWWNLCIAGNGGANGSRTIKIFKNGVQTGNTYTYDYNHTTSGRWWGANQNASYEYARAYFGHTVFYNKALTDSEILQNFNALKTRYGY